MSSFKIFVVEDDPIYGRILAHHLNKNPDYDIEVFSKGKEFINNLYKNPDIVTLDYKLPDMNGLEVLNSIKEYNSELPVLIISGQDDINTAVSLLKKGAYDYIVKDIDAKDRLWNSVKNLAEKIVLQKELEDLREVVGKKYKFADGIIGNSASMKKVFNVLEKAVKTNITVSITGETGTGKEIIAKAIHYNSNRRNNPFIVVNMSAIPSELVESELFGHEKGAFTGAERTHIGKFEMANGGTIFLDEIAEMSMTMQTKLLRVLQERELTRVGGNKVIKFNTRIITATHKDLKEEIRKGNFREDLYYRILGLPIELPPLRYRENDVIVLAEYFIDSFCKENNLDKIVLAKDAQKKILSFPFPGNVRELKAVVELAAVLSNDGVLKASDITFQRVNDMENIMTEELTLEEYSNRIIGSFLRKYKNNVSLVAKKLDIGKSTIYRMKKNNQI